VGDGLSRRDATMSRRLPRSWVGPVLWTTKWVTSVLPLNLWHNTIWQPLWARTSLPTCLVIHLLCGTAIVVTPLSVVILFVLARVPQTDTKYVTCVLPWNIIQYRPHSGNNCNSCSVYPLHIFQNSDKQTRYKCFMSVSFYYFWGSNFETVCNAISLCMTRSIIVTTNYSVVFDVLIYLKRLLH